MLYGRHCGGYTQIYMITLPLWQSVERPLKIFSVANGMETNRRSLSADVN